MNESQRKLFEAWCVDNFHFVGHGKGGKWAMWQAAYHAKDNELERLRGDCKRYKDALEFIAMCPLTGEWYDGRDGYQRDEYRMYSDEMVEFAKQALNHKED